METPPDAAPDGNPPGAHPVECNKQRPSVENPADDIAQPARRVASPLRNQRST